MRPAPRLPARNVVDLRDPRLLPTGASSGIGEAAAEKLAARSIRRPELGVHSTTPLYPW